MAEAEGRFSKGRLEAFSDGVIAVIITIMVLDLKAPQDDSPAALLALWPSFLSYFVSFVFAAVYWINHHHQLARVRRVTPAVIWANNALLFFISLFPFATAYMAATHIGPFPTMIYGAVQFACGEAFGFLAWIIDRQYVEDGATTRPDRAGVLKGRIAQGLYALSMPAAFVNPFLSIAIFLAIGLIYAVPDLSVQRVRPRRRP